MDTQLDGVEDDDEWAVDRILSHHGSRTDAIFEILWKSGDVTWLPYYQITHLQALTDYLGLLGVSKIAKLPKGMGRPPLDDPQVFVGAIMSCTPSDTTSSFCTSDFPSVLRSFPSNLKSTFRSFLSHIPFFRTPFISLTIDLEYSMPEPYHRGVNHPIFSRISPTHYLIQNDEWLNITLHVGQVADFLNYEHQLRLQKSIADFKSMPHGYLEFASYWNDFRDSSDTRRISFFYFPDDSTTPVLDISTSPVHIDEFFITPEQVGLGNPHHTTPFEPMRGLRDDIMKELAVVITEQRLLKRKINDLDSPPPKA